MTSIEPLNNDYDTKMLDSDNRYYNAEQNTVADLWEPPPAGIICDCENKLDETGIEHFHLQCVGYICDICEEATITADFFAYNMEEAYQYLYDYATRSGWEINPITDVNKCQLCKNGIKI